MPDLGPHAVFIWAAYGITFITVTALVLFILRDDRRQRQILAELERQGFTRRSAKPAATTEPAATTKPKPRQRKARARKPSP